MADFNIQSVGTQSEPKYEPMYISQKEESIKKVEKKSLNNNIINPSFKRK